MRLHELHHLLRADLFRYDGAAGFKGMFLGFVREPGFRYTALLRTCRFLRGNTITRLSLYLPLKWWLNRLSSRLGVYIDITTELGPGFYMAHPCGIVINRRCRIGTNCNVAQHVTLGLKSREPRQGCPLIGDRVFIGPGAVVIGAISVGNDAAIGANCVVTKDVPETAVMAGVPGSVVSMRGSVGYINYCAPGDD